MKTFTVELTENELDILISLLTRNMRAVQNLGAPVEDLKRLNARIQELEEMKQ